MEIKNKDLAMGAIILILIILTIVFWIRSHTIASREAQAYAMSSAVVEVLRGQDYNIAYPQCRTISAGRYDLLEQCLTTIKDAKDLGALFDEAGFRKFDEKRNVTGYIVIENKRGNRVFKSTDFSLYLNNELVASGCNTAGEIAPGFTCRFDLKQVCETGDNLEITYQGARIHLRNC